MKLDNYEETLRSFPHWYDKSPNSNLSKVIRVFNKQYRDKQHKIRTLDFSKRLTKPIHLYKVQEEDYVYEIHVDVTLPNIKTINFYINPLVNNEEEILQYDKKLFKNFIDDDNNTHYNFTYYGDTRNNNITEKEVSLDDYKKADETYNVTVNVKDSEDNPLSGATVQWTRNAPIIPTDTFIVEITTYDDYRWVKGFPENDQEELYKIYQEKQSYTDYLTFEINNNQVKDITVSKDNIELYKKTLLYRSNEKNDDNEYDSSKPYQIDKYKDVIIADSDKEHTIIHVILSDEDYTEPLFDWTQLTKEYPNIEDTYIISDGETLPSIDTLDTLVLKKQNNEYNAYKTIQTSDDEYAFIIHWYNVPYTRSLKSNYDLTITQYDKNHPNCPQYDKVITKRYTGNEKTNYDCFTHDYSLDMIGKYWNVPRLTFKQLDYYNHCGKINEEHYINTYPPYNDRLTEDDYHYEQRIRTYIQKYNKELFPLLELWKNYQVWGTLTSRKDMLSVQNDSYLQPYDYWEDTLIKEESRNKLGIVEGISNEINIDNHQWHEIVVANDIMVVPLGEYRLTYSVSTDNHTTNEGFHVYYYDNKGNCIKEEQHRPLYQTSNIINTYIIDETFTTIKEAVKMNIVIEADNSFYLNNANLVKLTLKDKGAMYMKTKKDYHSCVYDLKIDYNKVPTNISFPSTKIFDRLLQKSLPLTHKGFLNIEYSNTNETIPICEMFGDFIIKDYFDETNNKGNMQNTYIRTLHTLIKGEEDYYLNVSFRNKTISNDETYDNYMTQPYIKTTVQYVKEDNSTEEIELPKVIQSNTWVTLSQMFTAPENIKSMTLKFQSNNHATFEYKELSLRRDGKISTDEIWYNN